MSHQLFYLHNVKPNIPALIKAARDNGKKLVQLGMGKSHNPKHESELRGWIEKDFAKELAFKESTADTRGAITLTYTVL